MATKKFEVPSYLLSGPGSEMFAGTDVVCIFQTARDMVRVRMSRKHAEELRESLTLALARLDSVAASVGVGPVLEEVPDEGGTGTILVEREG